MGTRLKANFSFRGIYTLTLRNTRTGKKRTVQTHNVWTVGGWNFLFTSSTPGNYADPTPHNAYINGVVCGSGSGTPSVNDTALFNQIFSAKSGNNGVSIQNKSTEIISVDQRKLSLEFVIPASSLFVGTITELGLTSNAGDFITHAMLQDAEGNTISVEKTSTDELTIKVDIYAIRSSGKIFGLKFNMRWGKHTDIRGLTVADFCGRGCRDMSSGIGAYTCGRFVLTRGTNVDYEYKPEQYGDTNNVSNSAGESTIGVTRFSAESSPSYYANMLARDLDSRRCFFGIVFPDSDIFPQRTLTGLALGTGDGTTTEFNAILPAWVKETEKIYKNGTELTRGVDYTCDHIGNPQKDPGMTAGQWLQEVVQGDHGTGSYHIPGYYNDGWENVYATEAAPIILKYYEDPLVGNDVDTIVVGSWANMVSGAVLTYSISEDGETYTDVLSVTATGSTISDTEEHQLDKTYSMKYMKISVTWPDSQSDKDTRIAYQSASNSLFMHKGTGIVFTEAPAEGDVLTMDADIDRPWKSTDYIIDFSGAIKFV